MLVKERGEESGAAALAWRFLQEKLHDRTARFSRVGGLWFSVKDKICCGRPPTSVQDKGPRSVVCL